MAKLLIVKRPLSLFEVVIALGLTAILLTSLFSCYRHLVLTKVQLNHLHNAIHPKFLTQTRLMQIFDHLEESNVLYTDDGILYFRFDNGLDLNPNYCGPINGTLLIKEKNLVLSLKSRRDEEIHRDEILYQQVNEFGFLFFDPKKRKWVSDWKGSQLPPQVRIVINNEEKMTFSIPSMNHEAHYQ